MSRCWQHPFLTCWTEGALGSWPHGPLWTATCLTTGKIRGKSERESASRTEVTVCYNPVVAKPTTFAVTDALEACHGGSPHTRGAGGALHAGGGQPEAGALGSHCRGG